MIEILFPKERPFGGTTLFTEPEQSRAEPVQQLSRTAPGRLEAFGNDSGDEHTNLKKVQQCFRLANFVL